MHAGSRARVIAALLVLLTGAGASLASGAPGSFMGRGQVDAEVSEWNRESKVLRLKTQAGRLSLHATAASAAALRKGDFVVIDLTVVSHGAPMKRPPPQEDPPFLLTQRLDAVISGIERTLGIIALTSTAGRRTFELPVRAIAGARTGDPVVVDLVVRNESDVSSLADVQAARSKKGLGALLLMLFGRTR
jgi:hypothetical protein